MSAFGKFFGNTSVPLWQRVAVLLLLLPFLLAGIGLWLLLGKGRTGRRETWMEVATGLDLLGLAALLSLLPLLPVAAMPNAGWLYTVIVAVLVSTFLLVVTTYLVCDGWDRQGRVDAMEEA